MRRSISCLVVALSTAFSVLAITACSGGEIAVGKSEQQLQTKKDGGATGNGTTCSWDDTVAYDVATGTTTTTPSATGGYSVGQSFPSLDGCNSCTCSAQGIMCTMRACAPGSSTSSSSGGQGCTEEAKVCPDGTAVGRTGPNCSFAPCPSGGNECAADAKQCPDGTYVGRSGPNCEFAACPAPKACTEEAKQCPDGSYVGRTGPNCEFAPCPTSDGGGLVCTADVMQCPDGSYVGRTGPNCAFAPCPK